MEISPPSYALTDHTWPALLAGRSQAYRQKSEDAGKAVIAWGVVTLLIIPIAIQILVSLSVPLMGVGCLILIGAPVPIYKVIKNLDEASIQKSKMYNVDTVKSLLHNEFKEWMVKVTKERADLTCQQMILALHTFQCFTDVKADQEAGAHTDGDEADPDSFRNKMLFYAKQFNREIPHANLSLDPEASVVDTHSRRKKRRVQ